MLALFLALLLGPPDIAPLPASMCISDSQGSLSIDTVNRTFQLTLGSEFFEGPLDRFIWIQKAAYIIADVTSKDNVRFYANIGIRRNVGFADIHHPRNIRIGNPSQLDCFGNGPTGPPFEAHIKTMIDGSSVHCSIDSNEDLSRSNFLWQLDDSSQIISTALTPTFTLVPGKHTIRLTAIYEIEVFRDAIEIEIPEWTTGPVPAANAPPVLSITPDNVSGTKKLKISLQANVWDEGQVSLVWSLPDGSTSTASVQHLIFRKPGTYLIHCRATDSEGLTADATATITVTKR